MKQFELTRSFFVAGSTGFGIALVSIAATICEIVRHRATFIYAKCRSKLPSTVNDIPMTPGITSDPISAMNFKGRQAQC
jgi:hypothetical protein